MTQIRNPRSDTDIAETFLRLDTSNDPLTGNLACGGNNVGGIAVMSATTVDCDELTSVAAGFVSAKVNIIPDQNSVHDLGSAELIWNDVFTDGVGNTVGRFDFAAGIINTLGTLKPTADGTYDLGAVGAFDRRWRHLYLSGNLSDETNEVTVANLKTAYDHSQDNSQAHTDYLINNGNDTTTGTLTAAGFTTTGDLSDGTNSLTVLEIATADITFFIDGGGAEIADGISGWVEIPFACTILQCTLLADQTGSITIDIWKDTYANYPPDNADTITGANEPAIAAGIKDQDSTLTDWTTSVSAGDILYFNVDSCTTIEKCLVSLKIKKV